MISLICGTLKNDINELISKIETYLQTSKTNLWLSQQTHGYQRGRVLWGLGLNPNPRSLGLTYAHCYI